MWTGNRRWLVAALLLYPSLAWGYDGLTYVNHDGINSIRSASGGGGGGGVTWDPVTAAAVTLSGGNLVVTSTSAAINEQGAHVAGTSSHSSGKYYFEVTSTIAASGGNMSTGIGTPTSTFTGIGNGGGVVGAIVYTGSGSGAIWVNGSNTVSLGTFMNGNIAGVAADLDNRRIWFRKNSAGNWNNSGTASPATNTGGFALPAGAMVPFAVFGGGSAAGSTWTANFGASGFAGTVPTGFTAGW